MNKFILLFTFMFSTIFTAQLKLDIQLKKNLEDYENISKKNIIILTFTNDTNNDIVFPLNGIGMMPLYVNDEEGITYFDEEICTGNEKEYNTIPLISIKQSGKLIESGRGLHHINTDADTPVGKIKKQKFYSSLVFIKAHQKYEYQLYFNPHHFSDNGNEVFYWYYQTQKNIMYDLQIKFCINENVYKKLTKKQRKTLSDYKFFSGTLYSNEINYVENIDYVDDFIAK